MPLETGDDEDPILIVNMVEERVAVFNTKTRAPIMICLETINLSEARERKEDLRAAVQQTMNKNKKGKERISKVSHQSEEEIKLDNKISIDVEKHLDEIPSINLEKVDPSTLVNNPFGCADEDITPEPMKVKKMMKYESKTQSMPNFKRGTTNKRDDLYHFDKFAKLVEIEEKLIQSEVEDYDFLNQSESDISTYSELSSGSAFYEYESKRGRNRRQRDLFPIKFDKPKRPKS